MLSVIFIYGFFILADSQQELTVTVSVPFEQERSWLILPMLDLHDH
jgi:hypothetical protein